jgi:hypothetical protein
MSGKIEAIHNNMPPFGLLRATAAVPATAARRTARTRMGLPDPRPPSVPLYGPTEAVRTGSSPVPEPPRSGA